MIYHITTADAWVEALNKGTFRAESLATEGFIHCSTEEQLLPSAEKHWSGHNEVIVLHIVERRVKEKLKWEESRGGQLFPHIYSAIPLEAVETQSILTKGEDGKFNWIREF